MTDVSLNKKEQSAADAILDAMRAIRALADSETPANFENEVVPAIHTLQMFVLMHWAHRIHPDYWSNWFNEPKLSYNFSEIVAAIKLPPK